MHKFEKAVLKGLARLAIKSGSAFEAVKERIADNRKERREMVKAKVSDIKDAVVAQHEKVRAKRNEFRSKVGGKLKGLFGGISKHSSSSSSGGGGGGGGGGSGGGDVGEGAAATAGNN